MLIFLLGTVAIVATVLGLWKTFAHGRPVVPMERRVFVEERSVRTGPIGRVIDTEPLEQRVRKVEEVW